MVHYIRFLKPPKLEFHGRKSSVRALITIATDLGDDFYHRETPVYAILLRHEAEVSEWKHFVWKPGMRSLWIEFRNLPLSSCNSPVRLLVTPRRRIDADDVSVTQIPELLSVWSDGFGLGDFQAGLKIERRLRTGNAVLRVYEESGESIARHIWDAGVVLIAYLEDFLRKPIVTESDPSLSSLVRKVNLSGLRVIELGSGCGIVGMQIACLFPASHVLLTDLDDAMNILNDNIGHAQLAEGSKLEKAVLDWDREIPAAIDTEQFDLVVVSDCTYNCDSVTALVKTLGALTSHSASALILISMKVRHDSEAIFFDLMADAGLVQAEHDSILLSDSAEGAVELFVYKRSTTGEVTTREETESSA